MPLTAAYLEAARAAPLFAALDDDQFDRLRRRMQVQPFEAKQLVFQRGDPARHFYVVLEGSVKLTVQSRGGEEKIVERFGPGQSFAEALMFLEAPAYPVAAIGVEPGRLLATSSADYRAVLAESPGACLRLLGDFSKRLHGLVRDIEELTMASATTRFARLVLDLAQRTPPPCSAGPVSVTLPESKQMLASRLAIKPETLSRILRTLNDAGVVSVEGRTIHVHDVERLRAAA